MNHRLASLSRARADRADQRMAVLTGRIVFVTLLIWTIAGGSGGGFAATSQSDAAKYIVYTVPFTLGLAYGLTFEDAQVRIDQKAAIALVLYMLCAMVSVAVNGAFYFYALRDIAIISGYLLLLVFWFRAPGSLVDMVLFTLGLCLVVEASSRITPGLDTWGDNGLIGFLGLSNSFGTRLFGSHGVLESTLGFPLGLVFLFYVSRRRWPRALLAGILLFMAFKRIAFIGAALAICFDIGLLRTRSLTTRRGLALVIVIGLSVSAIYSTLLFNDLSNDFSLQNSSPDSISVGRYDIAEMLWSQFDAGEPINWLFGLGPGSADMRVASHFILINPHNDWLKILFDYGVVGFVAIHAVLFLTLARHRLGLTIYLYTATLMMTDNVFIYMFYHLIVALMMSAGRREELLSPGGGNAKTLSI